jgi:hypothetical protein
VFLTRTGDAQRRMIDIYYMVRNDSF